MEKLYNYICNGCGTEFQSRHKTRKFCSTKCVCNEMSKKRIKDYNELIGKKFGNLTVIRREIRESKHPYLLCECDCGKQVVTTVDHLLTGKTESCGCLRIKETFVENTSLHTIKSKIRVDNKSGVKGVRWYKPLNKWVAYIAFQKKTYHLGYYDDIKSAKKARKKAEKKYFKPMLEKYKKILP